MGGGGGYVLCAFLTHHRTSAAVGEPLPPLPVHHTATLAAVRPVDRLTRVQIQSRALQIWLISELLFLMNVWRMEHALFGGTVACVWPALTLSLSSPPGTRCLNACSSARPPLTRRSNILFERATPAYALLERLFKRGALWCARPRLRLRLAPYRSTPCGRSRVAASPVLRVLVPVCVPAPPVSFYRCRSMF